MQKGTGGVMGEHEIFKTTIMGGFDKEDVLEQVQRMKDEAAAEQLRLKKLISEKDAKIAELMKRIELKDAHQERLEMEESRRNTRSILTIMKASENWSLTLS